MSYIDYQPALAEILLSLLILGQILLGSFMPQKNGKKFTGDSFALLSLVASLGAVLYVGQEQAFALNGLFTINPFLFYGKVLLLGAAIAVLVVGRHYAKAESMNRFEYPILLQTAVLGMMAMVSANDLMSLYIGLELQSLSLYVLAAFRGNSLRSSEAGLKYFVLGAVSSGLLLYGCSLIYGFSGSTDFTTIANNIAYGQVHAGLLIGLVFLICGLAFKISAAPFHMWTPDVYEGSPTSVTAFFALSPKIAALILFMHVLLAPFGGLVEEWRLPIMLLSAASLIVGAFAALVQTNIKRLMAYSSIGHMGYVLMGVAAANENGVRAVLLYLSIYVFMNLGTFVLILGMRANDRMLENISDLAGLSRSRPGMAAALLIFMFSMAGIPPLAGFFGKMYVFLAAVEAGLIWLAVLGALTSVVSAYYYLRLIKIAYFDEASDAIPEGGGKINAFVLFASAASVLIFIAVISQAMVFIIPAATHLF